MLEHSFLFLNDRGRMAYARLLTSHVGIFPADGGGSGMTRLTRRVDRIRANRFRVRNN